MTGMAERTKQRALPVWRSLLYVPAHRSNWTDA